MQWKTREGKVLEVSDMETSHIQNALAMLRRKGAVSPEEANAYLCGPPSGDAAYDAWENGLYETLGAPVAPIIDEFEEELRKRGINGKDF